MSARGWSASTHVATTLVLVRHGITALTAGKRFSGGLGGSNPGLNDEGRVQVQATADWLGPQIATVDAVIASPVRRTHESAEIVARSWGRDIELEPGFAEMEFGTWDGLAFPDVARDHQADLDDWLGSMDVKAGGGESFRDVEERVLAALDRVLTAHRGGTVVVVSHVTPIKTLVTRALDVPLETVFAMELAPASMTVVSFFEGDEGARRGSLRLFNALPPDRDGLGGGPTRW